MKKILLSSITVMLPLVIFISDLGAHCQIPCGIYDDQLRAKLIAEHATTVEKSMNQIIELGKANPVNYNQLVRWVSNKESHATQIQDIVSEYFMAQRLKPDQKKYGEKLIILHKMLLAAMKCKQTTDVSHVNDLRALLKDFEILYFGQSDN